MTGLLRGVPDTRSAEFVAECRLSLLLQDDPQEADTIDWLANVADDNGWQ